MPRIGLPEIDKTEGKAGEIMDEVQALRGKGRVTDLWRAQALNPEVGYHFWSAHKLLMQEHGEAGARLSRLLREKIALVVSLATECKYCLAFHSSTLDRMGLGIEEIKQYIAFEAGKDVELPEEERVLLGFVRKTAVDPHRITDREVDQVRRLGFTDRDLVEILQIVMLFVGISRFVGVLQIGAMVEETEPWLRPYAERAVELKQWSW